jgi:hypothetical protein
VKAIETHYVGPSNLRGARIIAEDLDKNRVIFSYDHSLSGEDGHAAAALALCKKMGWEGELVAGATKRGYVFVFLEDWTKRYTTSKGVK